ncbi:MAG: nitroreductase family protein [Clostridia bacterium]|nr:nitroreductase family protein [Clostridia bacterium]MBQ7339115.1 nitroreductase family protein [Clostridia bacterium]
MEIQKNTDIIPSLLRKNRSYRRFGGQWLTDSDLRDLIECCTLTPSGGNLQRLRFCAVAGESICAAVYPTLKWAGYLSDWDGPVPHERPRGYIVLLCRPEEDNHLLAIDTGICAQSILLAATERGLGGCMIKSVQSDALLTALDLPAAQWHVALVIALGQPVEQVELVPVGKDGSIRYYRDQNGTHYVPKRSVEELMV